MIYSYGCSEEHSWDFGSFIELSFPRVKAPVRELPLKIVSESDTFLLGGLTKKNRVPFIEGNSAINERYII